MIFLLIHCQVYDTLYFSAGSNCIPHSAIQHSALLQKFERVAVIRVAGCTNSCSGNFLFLKWNSEVYQRMKYYYFHYCKLSS